MHCYRQLAVSDLGRLGILTLAIAFLAFWPSNAQAQDADGKRLIKTWTTPVKVDGSEAIYRFEIHYDYNTGQALRTVYNESSGNLVEREIMEGQPSLSADEREEAIDLVKRDDELGIIILDNDAYVDGGFILREETGKACAYPGSRCTQIDVLTKDKMQRFRYVVVDLMKGEIVYRDFQPDNPDLQ